MPNTEQQEAFKRLARNQDMQVVLSFYEQLLAEQFSVNSVNSLKDLISAQKSLKFIQEEFIDRLKTYEAETRARRSKEVEGYY